MKTFTISKNDTLEEVKSNFNKVFPNLALRFFKKAHSEGEGNPIAQEIKERETVISSISKVDGELTISVDGHKKVSTLEKDFEELGIHAQIFRKSGNVWLQTTTTDEWTLAEQNKEAEAHN